MKKLYVLGILGLMTILLAGCGNKKPSLEDQLNDLQEFSEQLADEMEDIDIEEFEDAIAEEIEDYEDNADMFEGSHPNGMPAWLKKLGMDEPKVLGYQKDLSYEYTEKANGYNAVELVYQDDNAKLLKEAARLAKEMDLPENPMGNVNEMLEQQIEMLENMGADQATIDEMKSEIAGAAEYALYTNYAFGAEGTVEELDYLITIEVDGDEMTISAIDRDQVKDEMEQYIDF